MKKCSSERDDIDMAYNVLSDILFFLVAYVTSLLPIGVLLRPRPSPIITICATGPVELLSSLVLYSTFGMPR